MKSEEDKFEENMRGNKAKNRLFKERSIKCKGFMRSYVYINKDSSIF